MLDHLIIHASDPAGMAAYYERVLGTLGYHKGVEYPGGTQFVNDEDGDSVWISAAKEGVAPSPSHYAWLAKTTDDVQAFYDAALQGGTDNGAPGPRDYHPATTRASCWTPRATTSRPCSTTTRDRRGGEGVTYR